MAELVDLDEIKRGIDALSERVKYERVPYVVAFMHCLKYVVEAANIPDMKFTPLIKTGSYAGIDRRITRRH